MPCLFFKLLKECIDHIHTINNVVISHQNSATVTDQIISPLHTNQAVDNAIDVLQSDLESDHQYNNQLEDGKYYLINTNLTFKKIKVKNNKLMMDTKNHISMRYCCS